MSTAVAPSPSPQPIVIPSLQELTSPSVPSTNPLLNAPPGAPPTPAPGAPPAVPPGTGEDAPKSRAPTTIMPGRDGEAQEPPVGKTPSEFAKERQQSKKQQVAEVERARDEAIAEAARFRIELEQKETALAKLNEDLESFRTLASTREKDLETFDERYFQAYGGENFNPQDDTELREAHGSMMNTLRDNMPAYVGTREGQKRVMFEQIAANPAIAVGVENCLLHYSVAQKKGDSETMDLAVNSICQILGADVDIKGPGNPENRTLTPDDPFFRDVERAMKFAVPNLQKKADRARFVHENAPKLAEDRFNARASTVRQQVKAEIEIPREVIAQRLAKDPNDTVAVFASILHAVPHLKEMAEAKLAAMSTDLACIPDNIIPPPLNKRDKVAMAEHRKQQDSIRERLRQKPVLALIGEMAGPIFTSLIAARDEALSRAGAASINTNPGPGGGGEGTKPVPATPKPNTRIMPDAHGN